MTDEEFAEQFADNINGFELTCSLLSAKDKRHAYRLGRYDGFLAGLKTGRPKWHDLQENPNDIPENSPYFRDESIRVIGTIPLSEDKSISLECRYHYSEKKWRTQEDNSVVRVTAWCEIPKYKED